MKQLNKQYNVPQEILYTVCLTAWKLCSSHLEKFAGLKAYYTEAFIADAVGEIRQARQLPELRQTLSASKEARINLLSAARQVMDNWQLLKRNIYQAFDKEMVENRLQAAGDSLYKKAALQNWSAVRSLVHTANNFIADNLDALTANGNMPAQFQTTFRAAGENFMAHSETFSKIKVHKQSVTQKKIDANNAIYSTVIEMLKDGQQIFRNEAAVKNQFFFKYLVSLQRGSGSASLKGYIVDSLQRPIEGATIISQDQQYMATTNAKGYYRISRIAAGTYQFNITSAGYDPLVQAITLAAGNAGKGDFELSHAMMKVA